MSKKSPQLRFEGFTDDWEDRELGEEFKKVSERNDGSFGRDHWISVAKMYFQSPEKVQSNNIDTRTYVMREGDIAFEGHPNSEFKFGRFVANDIGAGVVSELFPIYKHQHEYDNNYWKNAIQIERIMAPIFAKSITSSGNSSNKLDTKHFLRQKILIPQINEQKKMGSFFKQLDNTIALHQRKLDLLKEQKKGYLQKMFPKNGAKVPELRFAVFADDWEERKLAEFTTSFSGGTPSAGNSSYYKGDIPFIRSGEINSDKTELFLTEDGLKNSSAKMVSVGDILYALYGATSGEVGISQINGAINQAILAIRPIGGYSSHFIMQWLRLQKQKIIDKYLQGGQGNLSGSIVKNLILNVPNFEEQQRIGSFFKQLDDTIALHQRKLDLLKEQKKGFLQKMFV